MHAPSGALSSTMVALSNTLAASGFSILTRNKYYMVYVLSMCDMNKIGCAAIACQICTGCLTCTLCFSGSGSDSG